ncbi:sushi, von Willebrand factor type A, EGF and pentraxin domain-containing protein 1-like isoform X2 [Mercenaria mercenaria]|uniref:sushi, von Willebrand factor type A, EGF and pentraxin domain-containing protein 1-like isoform X2 n=1 Tax=Mercenaria mercenaria TaxID=6596 RepID=UPI00234F4DEA|nr:sushi, von Willebrand factor type A, EGF and pentraxin domain-containing protein 1-like isoform X2 [Mercenaria mercenaria]
MDVQVVLCGFMLFGILHVARLRSIDQIIEDVETDYKKDYTGPTSKFPSRVWYDYAVEGRTEELVKLQLDLIMTKELWDTVIDTEDALPTRNKRNAVKDKARLWPRRIPYILNDGFNISDKFKLLMAMDHWEEHTCLDFVEANKTKDHDYIEFVPIPYGCESFLGRMQGRQPINLAPPCMYKEVIVHEIGHALGLYHEHMRADRDNHVTIHYNHINETNHRQFDKLMAMSYDSYNKPYDYESIMHYGKLFFSMNRTADLITIEPKDAAYLDVIGEAPSLSFYDVKIVSEMYDCSAGCTHKVCPGNGFLGKNCECYCTGKDAYDIVLCEKTENCGKPNISLSEYIVSTNNDIHNITSWEEEASSFPHGTSFMVKHKNVSCGYRTASFDCSDGQWEGILPACEKACFLEDYSAEYIVRDRDNYKILRAGDQVLSADWITVTCNNERKDEDNSEKYIDCFDGVWDRNISDVFCIKEHPFCPMVVNSQLSGSFDDGFNVRCLDGYELKAEGEPGNTFTCSWEGAWEPVTPVCNPASCAIPQSKNNPGELYNEDGDKVLRGSEIPHGSDVTLFCPESHEPDQVAFSCQYGKWSTPDGKVPECVPASCFIPRSRNSPGELYNEDGGEVHMGSVIQHGSDVTLYCPKGHEPDQVTFSCLYGKWNTSDEKIPECIPASCSIPRSRNSPGDLNNEDGDKVLMGSEIPHGSDVTLSCPGGYEPDQVTFSCQYGKWNTPDGKVPECVPANCSIPRWKNSPRELYNEDREEVQIGSEIPHGSGVTLYCQKGHVPDPVTFSCQYGNWNTPDGKIPECVLVTCPKPTIVDAMYKPKQEEYIYGDKVRILRCKGILTLEGSRELECQKFGNWSDTAVCKPFCEDGEVEFKAIKNNEFIKGVWHRKFGLSSYSACEKRCRRFKSFLCASFVYGTDKGRHFCRIHPQSPDEYEAYVQKRTFWTIGKRECIRN